MKLIKSILFLALSALAAPLPAQETDTLSEATFGYRKHPNLHVLSIGVPFTNLKYTVKDAQDFAGIFSNQSGKDLMYRSVSVTTLTKKSETTRQQVRNTFRDLQQRFKAGSISPDDVLMVFISSHGMLTEDGKLRLLDSRANQSDAVAFDPELALDYEADILLLLRTIKCHRFLFVDACYSGTISDVDGSRRRNPDDLKQRRVNEALATLAEADPDIKTMVSCSASEVSWESQKWENGLFTKVLKEAFANKRSGSKLLPDANKNRILTIAEVYAFTRERSQQVMKSVFKNGEFTQTPYMPALHLMEDLPVFVLTGR